MTAEPQELIVERDLELEVDDGVVLRADVYRPIGDAPAPVILQRTPYDKGLYDALGAYYAEAGYVFVLQDVRGQFSSGGRFEPFVHEGGDGVKAVAWAAALPGTTGEVGMVGTSYQATCAWQAAVRRPPALRALACAVTPLDYYNDWFFPGGAFSLAFATTWLLRNVANSSAARLDDGAAIAQAMTEAYDDVVGRWYRYLPLREFPPLLPDRDDVAPYFFSWINEHARRDDYWQQLSLADRIADVEVPVLNVAGWYDVFVSAGAQAFQTLRASGTQVGHDSRLVVGPWGHNSWARTLGEVDFGPDAAYSFPGAVVAWMDRWLCGVENAGDEVAPVRYFSMGECRWHDATSWPPEQGTQTRLYLAGDHGLTATPGVSGVDDYVYDPANPVPSVGGHSCCYEPASPIGPYDQRVVQARSDVLTYATEPLAEPLRIAGPVEVELYAASTALDTDFTAKLVDVYPDGRAINLCEGIVRARRRHGFDRDDLLTPGSVERYAIRLQPTANVFEPGHRVLVEVSSSNFPAFDRNPNTGSAFGQDARLQTARESIHRGAEHPSCLILHVLEGTTDS